VSHSNAVVCSTCGATLSDVPPADDTSRRGQGQRAAALGYDNRFGESDLFEPELTKSAQNTLAVIVLVLALLMCAGIFLLIIPGSVGVSPAEETTIVPRSPEPFLVAPTAAPTALDIALATNTPRPAQILVTVTPAPPTNTQIPPPTPCARVVQPGDTLYAIAIQCGYRDPSIIDIIVAENSLTSPDALVIGQEIIVPAPTSTADPASTPSDTSARSGALLPQGIELAALVSLPTLPPAITPTATLQPGVMWHVVQPNETMISIALQYGANAEILSQLNPSVPFLQCDFKFDSGGPRCIVQLSIGQQIRVPAPTPTPTIPPTLSGSETPTPSATPTFNAPSAVSPGDRALFQADQLITLRWVTTGTLNAQSVYRVQVQDLTTGRSFTADTRELYFIVPADWQGRDQRRHEYEWFVSVIDSSSPDAPILTTQPRLFLWESRTGG
jgi:LysM repeat protein